MKKVLLLIVLLGYTVGLFAKEDVIELVNKSIRISWVKKSEGWRIKSFEYNVGGQWQSVGRPSGEYSLLYAAQKPAQQPDTIFKTITGNPWPDTLYKYQINNWKQATSPVSLNTAGDAYHYFPSAATKQGNIVQFTQETPLGIIKTEWKLDDEHNGDVLVKQEMTCKKDGYFSLASPSLVTVDEQDISWATVPGYFQGNEVQKNVILGYGYGQGIPALPVVYRERCASSFCPIITTREQVSFAVIPNPGLGRDPWAYDKSTHEDWFLGISHKNRRSQFSPTMYYPVLGEPSSLQKQGNKIQYGFRYSIQNGGWYKLLTHAVNDVYGFNKTLALRKNKQALVNRIEKMHDYLVDRKTSLWSVEDYKGLKIGGQAYFGGVVGSNRDAMKNSDYGAMWMLANLSGDQFLKDSVLPFALNFKLAQQQTDDGFFKGAAIGQYYLAKRKTFTEEWGEFVEPVSLTYYIMLDIGNILLFDPNNAALKERLALGADLLMKWQKPGGDWEVAYDKHTQQPLFTDIKDLRPTFYGLMVAYRILKDEKYLSAAKKGADWFIKNAVEKGNFIGVCGDARYAPDFATGQSAQALLDLYDLTNDKKYQDAAIQTARMYLTSIYAQPVASSKIKQVNGVEREDWQISQSGLSFEHGGILGSANHAGPIMLCSHAGMFVRMFQLTGELLFIETARAAAIGRDAFVDSKTSVASYYWNTMNKGAGPYPHHAWWQIGWITDYLMAEVQMRSNNQVVFPRGFVTPKVGPHESYGFAPGKIFGESANLIIREGLVTCDNPNVEYILAQSVDKKKLFIILLNDINEPASANLKINIQQAGTVSQTRKNTITELSTGKSGGLTDSFKTEIKGYGLRVYVIE
ncbi:glycerophosphoryl diester phosphodiesterase [Danxiaibacter flavus]|uniref:Glycerophosphoryl diester phosphodiesterase n=1 Tax=Danxiaibacter flavus TaxID=3049108 RepID=A0ABV3ZIA2_9BACT|nr:glycerophosphoryl diester phosphodiesterase [Chitinophagaceae bacterium DXS]